MAIHLRLQLEVILDRQLVIQDAVLKDYADF